MVYTAAEQSFFLNLLSGTYGAYCFLEEEVFFWYNQSRARSIFCAIAERLAAALRFSLLGRLAGIKEKAEVLENSKFIRCAMKVAGNSKVKIIFYFGQSGLAGFFGCVKQSLLSSTFKAGGLMVIAAVAASTTLSVLLKKEISPLGWIIWVAFVFWGFCGLSCRAGWDEVKNTSVFSRRRPSRK